MNILLVGNRHHHRLLVVYYFIYIIYIIINDKSILIRFTFIVTELTRLVLVSVS